MIEFKKTNVKCPSCNMMNLRGIFEGNTMVANYLVCKKCGAEFISTVTANNATGVQSLVY